MPERRTNDGQDDDIDTSEVDDLDEDEQRRLLDGPDDDDPEGADQLGDAGKRALDRQKQRAREAREARNAAIKERDDLLAWKKQQEDKDKSELERTASERDDYKTRFTKLQQQQMRRDLAEELAPDHATVRQIAQVAKRLQGDDEDALRKDAEELFGLIAPAPGGGKDEDSDDDRRTRRNGRPPGRPTERLRGGSSPDDNDAGEMDPYKLAASVPRRR